MEIKIYSTESCYKCKMIKQALTLKWVEFTELSAIDNYDDIKDCGYVSAPIICVNGAFMNWEEFMEYAMNNKII